jgi:hypothetical protein
VRRTTDLAVIVFERHRVRLVVLLELRKSLLHLCTSTHEVRRALRATARTFFWSLASEQFVQEWNRMTFVRRSKVHWIRSGRSGAALASGAGMSQ